VAANVRVVQGMGILGIVFSKVELVEKRNHISSWDKIGAALSKKLTQTKI
jgi:hypothetical protein